MFDYKKLIRMSFWSVSFPSLLMSSLYVLIHHQNPFDNWIFQLSFMLCLPMLWFKYSEFSDAGFENIANEFREMTNQEFLECEEEVMNLPFSRGSSLFKDAYRQVYFERWHRHYHD